MAVKYNVPIISSEEDLSLYREYTTGRPPVFNKPEDIADKFTNYIRHCINTNAMPTITGTALYLGFSSRQSFYDYEEREEFSYTMKRIRLYLEHLLENGLYKSINPTAFIFGLKNFGWADNKQLNIIGNVKHEHILHKSVIQAPPEAGAIDYINNLDISEEEKQIRINKYLEQRKHNIQEDNNQELKADYEIIQQGTTNA
jgi:hypothetical protein